MAAAAEIAHAGPVHLVLTARAENLIHGRDDLDDTIARLQAYQEAGADVLFAPGLVDARRRAAGGVVGRPAGQRPRPARLAAGGRAGRGGVARISVGGAFAFAALGAVVEAGRELLDEGTYGYWARSAVGRAAIDEPFRA